MQSVCNRIISLCCPWHKRVHGGGGGGGEKVHHRVLMEPMERIKGAVRGTTTTTTTQTTRLIYRVEVVLLEWDSSERVNLIDSTSSLKGRPCLYQKCILTSYTSPVLFSYNQQEIARVWYRSINNIQIEKGETQHKLAKCLFCLSCVYVH